MPPFISGVPVGESGKISHSLMIAIVGSLVLFLTTIACSLLVARKDCCASRSSSSTPVERGESLPSYHEHRHHNNHYARRGPVASSMRCSACVEPYGKSDKASRTSQDSLQSQGPPPPYVRRGPTGTMSRARPTAPLHSSSPSISICESASVEVASPVALITPPPTSPPPAYAARGPTATLPLRRAV